MVNTAHREDVVGEEATGEVSRWVGDAVVTQ